MTPLQAWLKEVGERIESEGPMTIYSVPSCHPFQELKRALKIIDTLLKANLRASDNTKESATRTVLDSARIVAQKIVKGER